MLWFEFCVGAVLAKYQPKYQIPQHYYKAMKTNYDSLGWLRPECKETFAEFILFI